ncbi:cytochrome b N-terminal domain-containing protein [Desulfosudis oleivorans]|uniref:Cytochrome b/b6 domain n=1 Tax=Desulfosudis oleivorans (strain DSM 6200 / JCM 39069 / Hxd3) TaxID=96561 RepID=A8ZSU5_DESOH|nr:cytochrome b N-terminal domain-containing protein [Desulfosudis oleivorans]ABW66008.1 Cytochrome b/b6 domain [Desulfosudis oleivorans Hxd3]
MKFKKLRESALWRSVFRHSLADTPRNRALAVTSNIFLHVHPVQTKADAVKFRFTFCLGGLTLLMFIIETVTGVLLMFYYRPVTEYAYLDMKLLEHTVLFGMFLRNMHRWAAHAMVILVMLHMLRVFLTGSYKPPREFNWVVGVLLLVITLLLSFTGYLLPWDQLAFWAITVGTKMAGATPFLGNEGPFHQLLGIHPYNDLQYLLLGDSVVGGNALLRFYVLHCVLLPLACVVLMAVHFWRIRKDGGISRPL